MKKTVLYHYIGTNGTITSPVFLKEAYSIKKYRLEAEGNNVLTKDGGVTTIRAIVVPEEEVDLWEEIDPKDSSK